MNSLCSSKLSLMPILFNGKRINLKQISQDLANVSGEYWSWSRREKRERWAANIPISPLVYPETDNFNSMWRKTVLVQARSRDAISPRHIVAPILSHPCDSRRTNATKFRDRSKSLAFLLFFPPWKENRSENWSPIKLNAGPLYLCVICWTRMCFKNKIISLQNAI